jgi:hypothetical protein
MNYRWGIMVDAPSFYNLTSEKIIKHSGIAPFARPEDGPTPAGRFHFPIGGKTPQNRNFGMIQG